MHLKLTVPARELSALGHDVRLIPPQYVKPFVKRAKNDRNDAAVCEVGGRPRMRFVPVKSADQQAQAMVLKVRETLVGQRTQLINALRGHAAEFGVIAGKGIKPVTPLLEASEAATLPSEARERLTRLGQEIELLDTRLAEIEVQPAAFAKLLAAADLVLVPCRPTFDDAESAAPFLKHMREQGKRAAVVLNFVKPRVNNNAVKAYLLEHGEICPVEIADRTDYARAGAKGMGLLDVPNHAGADEVRGVWVFVRNIVWGKKRRGIKTAA